MPAGGATEQQDKLTRLGAVAAETGVGGILLAAHHNIAWLTGGAANRIDASREAGSARLLVTAGGARYVLANAIEMPRLRDEELAGLGYEPIEYSWTDDQDPALAVEQARALLPAGASLGSDWPLPGVQGIEPALARARALLTDGEIARYRALGSEAGRVMERIGRALTPGDDERDVARALRDGAAAIHARAIVALVGSDDRLRRYRHPVPTATAWRHVVMMALCAERDGLVVSLSRIVAAQPPADLEARTQATATVFGRLLGATRAGASGADLYRVAADAYAAVGFSGEEQRHHQGGAIGYRAREWVAHPRSQEVVQPRQAFAWNPTITGTKIEDTALLLDGRIEIITGSPDWPTIAAGHGIAAAGIWPVA